MCRACLWRATARITFTGRPSRPRVRVARRRLTRKDFWRRRISDSGFAGDCPANPGAAFSRGRRTILPLLGEEGRGEDGRLINFNLCFTLALTCVLSPGERILAITFPVIRLTVRQIPAREFSRGRRTILLLPLVAPESDEGGWEKARLRDGVKMKCSSGRQSAHFSGGTSLSRLTSAAAIHHPNSKLETGRRTSA